MITGDKQETLERWLFNYTEPPYEQTMEQLAQEYRENLLQFYRLNLVKTYITIRLMALIFLTAVQVRHN